MRNTALLLLVKPQVTIRSPAPTTFVRSISKRYNSTMQRLKRMNTSLFPYDNERGDCFRIKEDDCTRSTQQKDMFDEKTWSYYRIIFQENSLKSTFLGNHALLSSRCSFHIRTLSINYSANRNHN